MEKELDVELLRRDLMNHYGVRDFQGYEGALEDLIAVDKAPAEELIIHAKKEGFDIESYYRSDRQKNSNEEGDRRQII